MSTFIYPLEETLSQVTDLLHSFLSTYGLLGTLPPTAIQSDERTRCRIVAQKFIELALNDELNSRMKWASESTESIAYITSVFPWWDSNCSDELSDLFYCDVIGEVRSAELMLFQRMIPKKTWVIWSLEIKGTTAFFTSGQDYRIVDYERRIRSGRLKVEPHIRKHYKRG